jgi:transcriptional regulator with XRE-family HTH domain
MVCASANELPTIQDFHDLFSELAPLEPFDIKKEELAAQLAALLAHTNTSRSEFAALADWKKSRVTAVLNGNGNPTFKTLWEFARFLGYEVDLHFRRPDEARALEPWNSKIPVFSQDQIRKGIEQILSTHSIKMESAHQVADALNQGKHKTVYFSMALKNESSPLGAIASINMVEISHGPQIFNQPLIVKGLQHVGQ